MYKYIWILYFIPVLYFILFQAQLSHGFPYTDRRADYGSTISGGATHGGRLAHEHDPLALHQALQNAVDDVQNPGMDDNVAFMSDLPLIKSKAFSLLFVIY